MPIPTVTIDELIEPDWGNAVASAVGDLESAIATINAAGWVVTSRLGDGQVTEVKLASNSVTAAKIAAGAVNTSELASNSVTTAKIGNGQVTGAKLASSVLSDSWTDMSGEMVFGTGGKFWVKRLGNTVFLEARVTANLGGGPTFPAGQLASQYRPPSTVMLPGATTDGHGSVFRINTNGVCAFFIIEDGISHSYAWSGVYRVT